MSKLLKLLRTLYTHPTSKKCNVIRVKTKQVCKISSVKTRCWNETLQVRGNSSEFIKACTHCDQVCIIRSPVAERVNRLMVNPEISHKTEHGG